MINDGKDQVKQQRPALLKCAINNGLSAVC